MSCIEAAELLQSCLNADIQPHLAHMAAVKETTARFVKLKGVFAKRLSHHLNNLFIHQVCLVMVTIPYYFVENLMQCFKNF